MESWRIMTRIAKDPKLTEHYMKVLMEAGNENLPGMVKHLNALDKEVKKLRRLKRFNNNRVNYHRMIVLHHSHLKKHSK